MCSFHGVRHGRGERLGTKGPSSGTERAQMAMTVGSEEIVVEDRL